ncbi:hypothetical protein CMO96_05005 [Candidatus Woesebacteria bacterium]|nr:hypothetical protein [Candidatus Woesebacteria bacterium]
MGTISALRKLVGASIGSGLLMHLLTRSAFAQRGVQDGVATFEFAEVVFENVLLVIFAFAAIVLFIMFLIGGFRYLTSGGDPKAVEGAKGTLTHAIAGLVVLVLAFIILKLIETITGVDVTTFKVIHNP